jgi:hypothetical protein
MLTESFCKQDLRKNKTSQPYPQFAQNSSKSVQSSQCGPWAMGEAQLAFFLFSLLLNYSSLHSFKQPKTYQFVPVVPTGSNDQEYSLGQQGIDFAPLNLMYKI